MTEERTYDEGEVAEIFEAATDAQRTARARMTGGKGLTLRDLHGIAEEVGIPADLITRAAHDVAAPRDAMTRKRMGVPFGVVRTVELPRALTELEWQRLVASLRETFGATGRVEGSGELRQWWNGNLRVLMEPTGSGHRLRMTTTKGDLQPILAMGFSILAMALVLLVAGMVSGTIDVAAPIVLGFLGIGTLGVGLGRLPFWARTRARQMDEIAARVTEVAALPPAGSDRAGPLDATESA